MAFLSKTVCFPCSPLGHCRTFPLLASNRKCKGEEKQVPAGEDRRRLGGAFLGHTHHRGRGTERSLGSPAQSLWCQDEVAHSSLNSKTGSLLPGPHGHMIKIDSDCPHGLKSASCFKKSRLQWCSVTQKHKFVN